MRRLVLAFALVACAKKGEVGKGATAMPGWYAEPPPLCGVGSAMFQAGLMDTARLEADNNARGDLARQFQTKVEAMVKNYGAQGQANGEKYGESATTNVTRNIVDLSLTGARSVKNEILNETMFTLVCLQPDIFLKAFESVKDMDDGLRAEIKQRMDAEFADLDAQLQRLRSE
ncbi:MAG: hypothetical protein RLZZ383_506 [Pseudomonadota bacterium]|jgi:hypothetical protein